MEEEQGREYLRQRLRTFEREASEEKQEEVEKLRLLREHMESVYPHENLKNLYTKTTVSGIEKGGNGGSSGRSLSSV